MKRFSLSSFLAGAITAGTLVAVPASAAVLAAGDQRPTAYDGTSPSLTVQPVRFVPGAVIDATTGLADCDANYNGSIHYNIPLEVRWSGSDGTSGLAGYDVYRRFEEESLALSNTQQTSLRIAGKDVFSPCGGGDAAIDYRVVAKDHRQNSASSAWFVPGVVSVWQEDGTAPWRTDTVPVAKSGAWRESPCACSDGRKTWYSTTAGSSLSYTVTTGAGATFGLVMGRNSNRGQVAVSVDGRAPVTVDTYAASPLNRVIVWQTALSAGTHTVKLVNKATPGRPRVDVDAVMLTMGQTEQLR